MPDCFFTLLRERDRNYVGDRIMERITKDLAVMKKKKILWGGAIFLLAGILAGCSRLGLEGRTSSPTKKGQWIQCDIQFLSDKYIVYLGTHKHLGKYYMYLLDLKEKTTRKIIKEPVKTRWIRFSEGRMVVEEREEIYLYEISSGKKTVIYSKGYRPDISGNMAIWRDRETLNLCLYDIKTGKIEEFGKVGLIFRISGDWLVWRLTGGGIRILNLSTGEKKEIDMGQVRDLDIAGDILVTSSGEEKKRDIFMYDLRNNEKIIVSNAPRDEYFPVTDGKRIAWVTPISEAEFRPLPWSRLTTHRSWNNIYVYDIKRRRKKRILHNDYRAGDVHIQGNRVVWTSGRTKRPRSAKESNQNARDIYIYEG